MNILLSLSTVYPENIIEYFFVFFFSCFFLILFIQSGCDKVMNFNSNNSFIKQHFSQTFLKDYTNFLFITLTILELVTAGIFLITLLGWILFGFSIFLFNVFILGVLMANLCICCLFLGQRIANDYVGAATLTNYFFVALLGLFFLLTIAK